MNLARSDQTTERFGRVLQRLDGPCVTKQRVLLLLVGAFHLAAWTFERATQKSSETRAINFSFADHRRSDRRSLPHSHASDTADVVGE